ncbi:MAG TPA: tetratricopeptide repeat protein [Anaeromyxobacter sp.]|nr:tetratricopeptide repeat protein [Anaeromyxobacter sp.]
MLFGDGPSKAPPPPPRTAGYHVRRRSGKVFGPFEEAQIVEMLSKGELLGNEDVSTDGSSYTPIGAVPSFGAALRKATTEPVPKQAAPVVFGDRMAAVKVVEGGSRREIPRAVKWAALALPAVLLLAVGVGAGFTRYGFFFTALLRHGDPVALANLLGQARSAMARGDFPSERAALDHAARAVAADPRSGEAAMIHALAVAALEQKHGAPPEALAQARKTTEALERQGKKEVAALAARLAMDLCNDPISATAAEEAALEAAQARRKPDVEVMALLARSALTRGDAARAAIQANKLTAMEKGPRGPLLLGQAAMLRKAPAEARTALEQALKRDPELLAAQLELATLDEQTGDLESAAKRLSPLAADAARARLAPAERARALALLGSIAAVRKGTDDPDKLLEEAVAADPRLVDARVRLILRRLRNGDPAGAVAASDPVAQVAVGVPPLAAARVRALAAAGRALDASQLADQALVRSPGRIELLLGKAYALEAAGKPDDAKRIYTDALARNPEAMEARVALTRLALGANDLSRAAELLGPAMAQDPRDPAAYSANGDLLRARGDTAGAEAAYRKALSLDPACAAAEVGLARLAQARGEVAGARTLLASAVKHDARSPDTLVEYATLLWKMGDLDAAERSLTAALEFSPRHALALSRLGTVLLQKGDAEGAVRRLTAASNEAPDLVEARLWLGRALLSRGETPGAITQLKKAVDLARTAENLLALGAAYEKAGAVGDALDAYRSAAEVAPTSPEPQERTAVLLAASERCDQAIPAYQRAIDLDPRSSRLKIGLASCTARLGRHEEAVKLYQAILKSDPGAVQVYYLLARSLHESQGAGAALPYYRKAAEKEPSNPMPHYYLGYAYKEQRSRAKAVEEFKKFVQLKPNAPERADIEAEIEDLGGR